MGTSAVLASVSLLTTVTYLGLLAELHALPTGYNPIQNAVSDYAIGRQGFLFRLSLGVSALGALALALALLNSVGAPPLPARDLVFLFLIPVARVGMIVFPTDLEGAHISRSGARHYGFAIAAFTFTYLVISESTPVLRTLGSSSWLHASLKGSAILVPPELALLVLALLPRLRRVFGLFERLFLVTSNVWFGFAALFLIDRAR